MATALHQQAGPQLPAFSAPTLPPGGANPPGPVQDVPQKAEDYRAFHQRDLQRRSELAKRLQSDPKIMDVLKRWDAKKPLDRPSAEEKLDTAKAIAKHQAEVYGISQPKISLESNKALEGAYGAYDDTTGELTLNRDKLGTARDFVDTVTHEVGHHYQAAMAKAYKEGRIPPGDPDYPMARSFSKNDDHYQPADDSESGGKAYMKQPTEFHAFATGQGIATRVFGPGKGGIPKPICACTAHKKG